MLKRKYMLFVILLIVSVLLTTVFYNNIAKAQHNRRYDSVRQSSTWHFVTNLTISENGETPPFYIDGKKWRIIWHLSALSLERSGTDWPGFVVYDEGGYVIGDSSLWAGEIIYWKGILYLHQGEGSYHIRVTDVYGNWTLIFTVESYLLSEQVGGLWIPVDKFSLLSPYVALASTIILAVSMSVAYIKYRKKQ